MVEREIERNGKNKPCKKIRCEDDFKCRLTLTRVAADNVLVQYTK